MKRLVIFGAGGHGKVVADIASNYYEEILFFVDKVEDSCKCLEYPVSDDKNLMKQYFDDSDFFVAIGNAKIRAEKIRKFLKQGVKIATLIHPSAIVGESVTIGKGTVIMAGTILNAECKIGDGCIINTAASVDHDCQISDYVHISVGAHVCGTVMVSENTWIGAGATVSNNVNICADCMIGAGAVVIKNIEEPGTYVGVPARKIG